VHERDSLERLLQHQRGGQAHDTNSREYPRERNGRAATSRRPTRALPSSPGARNTCPATIVRPGHCDEGTCEQDGMRRRKEPLPLWQPESVPRSRAQSVLPRRSSRPLHREMDGASHPTRVAPSAGLAKSRRPSLLQISLRVPSWQPESVPRSRAQSVLPRLIKNWPISRLRVSLRAPRRARAAQKATGPKGDRPCVW
jgi:hypothetical protein